MRQVALYTLLVVSFTNLHSVAVKRWDRGMGRGIVKSTLKHVLLAPINLFFDVTPLGKILGIFQDEINIFRQGLFKPLRDTAIPAITVFYNIALMMQIGIWETLIGMTTLIISWYYVYKYFSVTSIQMARIRMLLDCKTNSNFYQGLRGANIARAFGQENFFSDRLLDNVDERTVMVKAE